jgi:dTDP-4-amino-4,6-dideoxygalactose transaminase
LRAVGVIAVDLFGQPADYDAIDKSAVEHGMWVLSDAAQSFGSTNGTRRGGTYGTVSAISFLPTKALGGYGDGGAVFTADKELAARMHSLRDCRSSASSSWRWPICFLREILHRRKRGFGVPLDRWFP